jgi:nucleolar complex protein 2
MGIKHQNLMKSFSGNFVKIMTQILDSAKNFNSISGFLIQMEQVVKCSIPFPTYFKKLTSLLSKICVDYSLASEECQALALNGLRAALIWTKSDSSLFEYATKKMYNEYAKHSKQGGGGFNVWSNSRMAMNCMVEILRINPTSSYQIGFLYIRQLCLHLRNVRNNMTKDSLKAVYSW